MGLYGFWLWAEVVSVSPTWAGRAPWFWPTKHVRKAWRPRLWLQTELFLAERFAHMASSVSNRRSAHTCRQNLMCSQTCSYPERCTDTGAPGHKAGCLHHVRCSHERIELWNQLCVLPVQWFHRHLFYHPLVGNFSHTIFHPFLISFFMSFSSKIFASWYLFVKIFRIHCLKLL